MNAVGIDVSKGKSTVAVLRPFGEMIVSPFDVSHNPKELTGLVTLLKTLDGDTKVVMEYTGNYYLPIALFLRNNGFFVSVVNPILVKDYNAKSLSVRKAKTDKKDSLKLASFALDHWLELPLFSAQSHTRSLLKSFNRQYNQYMKIKVMLKNNLISLLDQTFPAVNSLFRTPAKKTDGHEKWIDFVLKYPHCECISKKTFQVFSKSYLTWCHKFGYHFSDAKAKEIYEFACNCAPSLPLSEGSTSLITSAISQLNSISETLASLAMEMNNLAKSLPEYDVVMSMFGVGAVLGCQLMAEIGDVSRFHNKKALVGFAGIDAPPYQSGTFNPKSRSISKRGSGVLRKTLFQVMAVILQRAPADNSVFQFMDKKRSEGKHYYIYMTAAANKFLRIYYARVTEHLNSLQLAS
jgi:transposase